MKFKSLLLLPILLMLSQLTFAVTLTSMTKDQVTQLVQDHSFMIGPSPVYRSKHVEDPIMVYFGSDNSLQGKWAHPMKSVAETDTGTWSIKPDGQFCVEWKTWGSQCMYYFEMKDNYLLLTSPNETALLVAKKDVFSGNKIK